MTIQGSTKMLVNVITGNDGGIHLTLFRLVPFSLPYAAPSQDYALQVARKICVDTIEDAGKEWVEYWARPGEEVNCPEGAIKLPADIWVCKLSGKVCALQAAVLKDRLSFYSGCHAPDKKKEQIFNTVSEGRYLGFHHVAGRYLCVACERRGGKKESFFYHYPWEFAELDTALRMTYEEGERLLVQRGYPKNYVSSPLCAPCCRQVAHELCPSMATGLHVLELDVDLRSGLTYHR